MGLGLTALELVFALISVGEFPFLFDAAAVIASGSPLFLFLFFFFDDDYVGFWPPEVL